MNAVKFIIFLLPLLLFSQENKQDSILKSLLKQKIFDSRYSDFKVSGNMLYGLNYRDSLIVWDLNNNSNHINVFVGARSIAKNNKGQVVYCTRNGKLFNTCNPTDSFTDINIDKVYYLFLDDSNEPIFITPGGIFYKGTNYFPERKNVQRSILAWDIDHNKILSAANVYFLDSKQRLWMGYDEGEFGGGITFFDLNTKEYYNGDSLYDLYLDETRESGERDDKVNLYERYPDKVKITEKDTLYKFPYGFGGINVKGIAEDDRGNFYVSNSLMHFYLNGSISKIKYSGFDDFYRSKSLRSILKFIKIKKRKELDEYIGPVAYNPYDKHMYYYSDLGFSKIIEKPNDKFDKMLVLDPKISWKYGMSHSVGYGMNVDKFEFIDAKRFIFLTTNNGIGYYDGKEVSYFK